MFDERAALRALREILHIASLFDQLKGGSTLALQGSAGAAALL